MNRREFIKLSGILGLGLSLSGVAATRNKIEIQTDAAGKVIIIGAGVAGLSAGYLLQQQGIEFQILEASSIFGGRMKRTTEFTNFPIPLGAEWVHVPTEIFEEIINDDSVKIDIETTKYDLDADHVLYQGEQYILRSANIFTEESKFINATWFDFFEQYVTPLIEANITYNSVVEAIDYSAETIQIKTRSDAYLADQVIVTVPLKMLQNGAITFIPELSKSKQKAIYKATVWDGCKAFVEFSKKFYPALTDFDITPKIAGQKLYYDAAYGQETTHHILGLFAVGSASHPYVDLSDDKLIEFILNELDELFGGQASPNYMKHIFQNWNEEPYANGAYIMDCENWKVVRKLGESVNSQLHFAGDAYTEGSDWGSVHEAARSARRAVEKISRS